MKKMNIGIAGTRGIPNAYGGFEQFVQYLSAALVKKGHTVTVYNSSLNPYKKDEWEGVRIVVCKDWEDKLGTAGQFFYDRNCIRDARTRNFDILLHLGYTSSSIWWCSWPKQSINLVNMDGLEWLRPKYSALTKRFLKKAEKLAAKHAGHLIADSPGIQDHLLKTYNKTATYIPYGAELVTDYNSSALEKFQLTPGKYHLLIARMEPDNNIEMIITGWISSSSHYPLILIGNATNKYGKYLTEKYKDSNIRFIGSIYDKEILNNIRHYSKKYFHGHSAGGTNPSLLEAMACQCDIAAHNNIFNRAVTGDNADYFSTADDIAQIIQSKTVDEDRRKELNTKRIETEYNWPKIVDAYETLMYGQLGWD